MAPSVREIEEATRQIRTIWAKFGEMSAYEVTPENKVALRNLYQVLNAMNTGIAHILINRG